MKYLILVFAFLLTAMTGTAEIEFQKNSRLAAGRWVKVQTGNRGIYSVSYTQLLEMGFPEPQKVGAYGKGGTMLDVNFVASNKEVLYEDDLRPVSVVHENEQLMFYAEGIEKLKWDVDDKRFLKDSRNLYSDYGIYFLSDSEAPLLAKECALKDSDAATLETGLDYLYHEKDLAQNDTHSGQIFWGECFNDNGGTLKFKTPAEYAIKGDALLEYAFFLEPNSSIKLPYSGFMAIEESKDNYSINEIKSKTSKYDALKIWNKFEVEPQGEFNITLSASCGESSYANLDYWILTYLKRFPSNKETLEETEHYFIPASKNQRYKLSLPTGVNVWDITDPNHPVVCKPVVSESAEQGCVDVIAEAAGSEMLIAIAPADEKKLQTIKVWYEVGNQNIHSLGDDDVEFVIVTIPEYKEYADEIAKLHRDFDNTNTAVVTTEQMYNEFSGGVPDPMAYRGFMKMLYERGKGCLKNLLLLGSSLSDFRNTDCPKTPYNIHIAYQEPNLTSDNEGATVYDFYGMLADKLNVSSIYKETVNIGVGVLNCNTEAECRRAVRKIRYYLENRAEYPWQMNDILTLGGEGDAHTHDWQAENYANIIRGLTPAQYAVSNVSVDALGYDTARKKFISKLEEGKLCLIYFGHGDGRMIGPNIKFFSTPDVSELRNNYRGFMFLGGCRFSAPSKGSRGLGEDLVLSTDGGMIGGIVSTRASLSQKNYELSQKFANSWLSAGWDTFPTIGEIYAKTKSNSTSNNSLSYIYVGDPALKVPVVSKEIEATVKTYPTPGGVVKIKGNILDKDGVVDKNFNGLCVVKVMKPTVTLISKDYVTGTCSASDINERDTLLTTYMAERLLAMDFEVKNGEFLAKLPFVSEYEKYVGKELGVYLSAVDSESLLGAVGYLSIPVKKVAETGVPAEDRDEEAPMLSVWFDSDNSLLHIEATDNCGIMDSTDIMKVSVDGKDALINKLGSECRGSITNRLEVISDMDCLASGKHVVSVNCADVSGNIRKIDYDFEKLENKETIDLAFSSRAIVDSVAIAIDGTEDEEVELTIVDSEGNKVLKRTVNTQSYEWDCKDENGVLLPAGLYRVKACTTPKEGLPKYSRWETIAILQ